MHNPQIQRFRQIPRYGLLGAPTPIEPLSRLAVELAAAPNLYIKRDDFTTYLVGGNKVRKLEYTMADILRRRATAVVTIGSIQSNHARITAMVSRRLGLKCYLVLNGEGPDRPTGNALITKLLGIEVVPVASRQDRVPAMDELARDLERRGEKVAKVPLGASDEVGSFGLTAGFAELIEQEQALGLRFDTILIGTSSGGTQAGLEVGKRLFDRPGLRIIGVSPDDPAAGIRSSVTTVADAMSERLGLADGFDPGSIEIDESQIGGGYGVPTAASEEAACLFSKTEGVLLDPVYTSKVAAALIDDCRRGCFPGGHNVLFWHTGGLIGLFC
jgi:1-aminocyclopropane-1-carboxylate deaminase/D-cysteine desulfhydrase-like pyridoxal-dependent ACC family enzyme